MIINNTNKESDSFLDVNNDIYRIITALNNNQSIKKLLINTDKEPLEGKEDISNDLRDKQISRVPILPYDEEEGGLLVVSFISGDISQKDKAMSTNLAIDIFVPGNQWIINEGIRPLIISHYINKVMNDYLVQSGGIKYRLSNVVNAQLSDILLGYRLIYDVVIDD